MASSIVAMGLAAIVAWVALVYSLQRVMLFPQPGARSAPRLPPDATVARVGREGGVDAFFLPAHAREGPAPVILFAHGNGELIDDWVDAFETPRGWGFGILLVEYPGYGRSSGAPSQVSLTEATVAGYDFAAALPQVDSERIIGYGRSLGGGVVCALSRQRKLAALVLQSTFTSVRSMAPRFGLPGPLVRDPFDNLSAVTRFAGPVLVAHGVRDGLIPPSHGEALARASDTALRHLACSHNDCGLAWPEVGDFLERHGLAVGVAGR